MVVHFSHNLSITKWHISKWDICHFWGAQPLCRSLAFLVSKNHCNHHLACWFHWFLLHLHFCVIRGPRICSNLSNCNQPIGYLVLHCGKFSDILWNTVFPLFKANTWIQANTRIQANSQTLRLGIEAITLIEANTFLYPTFRRFRA